METKVQVHIRKAGTQDVPAIAKVHVDSWRTSYVGIVATEFLVSLSYKESERMWRNGLASATNPVSLFVVERPVGSVVGFAAAGPEREHDAIYKGEIYALYLLQNCQRQGIGSALFRACVRELAYSGFSSLLVWVLKTNPARRFYEAMGGKVLREREIPIGNERLMEVAYGWADTRALVESSTSK